MVIVLGQEGSSILAEARYGVGGLFGVGGLGGFAPLDPNSRPIALWLNSSSRSARIGLLP